MDYQQRITKTDLARSTDQVTREAQRGYTVLVEDHGQPEVAIIDIVDFQLQRAAAHYFAFTRNMRKISKSANRPWNRFPLTKIDLIWSLDIIWRCIAV